jgi:uncharacterized membrane protein
MFKRVGSCLAVAAAVMVSTPSEGLAQFRICNRSSAASIDVAFGMHRGRSGWEAEGWFTVRNRQCATIAASELRERYFYLYGDAGDTVWDGENDNDGADFCVHPGGAFKLNDDTLNNDKDALDCEGHGYESRKFLQVDTRGATSFTFDFVD